MDKKPLIFIPVNNEGKFCDNRCANKDCSKHLSNLAEHKGFAVISKMRDTQDCEGYISKWEKTHKEIEQIKAEMRENGME